MKRYLYVLLILSCCCYGWAQPGQQLENIWSDMIEIEQGTLMRHILNDIPGSVGVIIPEKGKIVVKLLPKKVLKDNTKLPELQAEPTLLISSHVTKTIAANIGFLSFIAASMSYTDELKFNVTETCHASVKDADIDWDTLEKRIKEIVSNNPNLPSNIQFGVVKVVNIISINYEEYKKVNKASKISGWGFNAGGKCLSEKGNAAHAFKVGVALVYPNFVLENSQTGTILETIEPSKFALWKADELSIPEKNRILNVYYAKNLAAPATFVKDIKDNF